MSTETSPVTFPKGWREFTLGELTQNTRPICYGVLKPGDFEMDGVPLIRIVDMKGDVLSLDSVHRISTQLDNEFSRSRIRGGEVLLSIQGTIGRVAIAPSSAAGSNISRTIAIIEPDVRSSPNFVRYWLMWARSAGVFKIGGTTRDSLNIGDIRELAMPIPSLVEQSKIVAILEEQLSRLDTALASVDAIRQKSSRFRRAILHAAFTGRLTSHDTPDGTLPDGWGSGSLGEFCEMYQPKTISTKELIEDGEFPVYGANGQIGFYDKYNHNDPEVTVTCRGATCGTVNVIPGKSWITGNAMVVRPKDNCMSKSLLNYQLQSLDFTQVITGTAQPQITRTTLTEIKVVLPPLDEQARIVQILEEQLSRLDASLAVTDVIEMKAFALRRSLLHAAFMGNLTKEWREGAHV
jgi:restriction endonuclease S subunit